MIGCAVPLAENGTLCAKDSSKVDATADHIHRRDAKKRHGLDSGLG